MKHGRWILVLLAATVALACPGAPERSDSRPFGAPELGLDLEPLRVGSRRRPALWVGARQLHDRLGPTRPFELDRDYVLEFVPLALPGHAGPGAIETWLSLDGKETLLSTDPLRPVDARASLDSAVAVLGRPVQVRLEARPGRVGELLWKLAGTAGAGRAAVANPELHLAEAPAELPPDVLFICSDTHRHDYALGPRSDELMPELRQLQRQAVTYRQAFSTASWTMPSLASLLTGLFARQHLTGRRTGTVPSADFRPEDLPTGYFGFDVEPTTRILSGFPRQLETLPERLRAAGYETAMVVSNPLYTLSGVAYDGVDIAIDVGVAPVDKVQRAALEVLRRAPRNRPLFLLVHYMDVHQWGDWYFAQSFPELDRRSSPAEVRQSYAEAVRATDRALGELVSAWAGSRGLATSMVAFFSDHGEHLLDSPRAPRLGHGNSMAEELLRVPLVVRYPESLGRHAGEVDDPVSLVDLAPTVLEVAGLPADLDAFSGRSLLAPAADPGGRVLFADFQLYGEEMASVRRGGFKLVLYPERQHLELIEVSPDGAENEAAAGSPELRDLRRAYLAYVAEAERLTANLRYDRPIDQEEARRQLEALGYIQ